MPVARTPGENETRDSNRTSAEEKYKPKTLQPVVSFNCKAEKSTDDSYREKAQKLKQILLSTTDVVLNETGSDDGYDLLHLIKKHHQLLPMNFDDEFVTSVAESDELPDVSDWNEIYKGKRGFK